MAVKVKNTIPVYDIKGIGGINQLGDLLIAERFAPYLQVHPNLHAPHKHDFYHVVLFTRGSGFHTIDFEQFPVKPGQVYFMVPGQVHSWSFKDEVDGYIINFSGELFSSFLQDRTYAEQFHFFRGIAHDCVVHLGPGAMPSAVAIMEQLIAEVADNRIMQGDMIATLLVQLFILVHRETPAAVSDRQAPHNRLLVSGFQRLVAQHYRSMHLPGEYAAMLYITPNYLNSVCKDVTGKPAGQVIRDRILLEAKRMLVNAELNIEAIGDYLGFADNSYFTKFF